MPAGHWVSRHSILDFAGSCSPLSVDSSRAPTRSWSPAARPMKNLTVAPWIALSKAVVTEDVPLASLKSGDRLPYSGRVSGNLSIDQEFPLANGVVGSVGGA